MSSPPPPVPPKDTPPKRRSVSSESSESSESRTPGNRGYTRPFPLPSFSSSAMNRNSVLALGKIEHLQHYFALTGKLDKKGANYMPSKPNQKADSTYSSMQSSPEIVDLEIALPPERDSYTPVPFAPKTESLKRLRGDLVSSLTECKRSLTEADGMEIVEKATATIRLAQRYRAHIRPEDADDEKKLRTGATDVLIILRKIAEREGRNVGADEKETIEAWCKAVERRVERDDEVRQKRWEKAAGWMEDRPDQDEWERYYLFLVQFDSTVPQLPEPHSQEFLEALRPGTRLCQIHNALTHFSLRPFGLITRFHTDTTVQYRVTDNLRYFAKAAEIRWEIHLDWDVEEIWRASPEGYAILREQLGKWCHGVINEMKKIYQEEISEGADLLDQLMGEMSG